MGNYKEGYIQVFLRNDTPMTVIESLVDLMYFPSDYKDGKDLKSDRIMRLKNTRKEKFFQGEIGRLMVEIDPTFMPLESHSLQTLDMNLYVIHCYCLDHYITDFKMMEDLYCDEKFTQNIGITSVKKALKKRKFSNLWLRVLVNAKQYTSELDDLIDFLKPYLVKGHENKVGHIKDEDGYLNKDIYLDKDFFKKQLISRKYICEGCEDYKPNFDCENWKKCKTAYEKGLNAKNKSHK